MRERTLNLRRIPAIAATVLACAAVSAGAPVNLSGGGETPTSDYAGMTGVSDPVEGVFESPSWDVQRVEFLLMRSGMYVHVDTVGPFDRNGGDTSITQVTLFVALLTDGSGTETQMIELTMTDTSEELRVDGALAEEGPHLWEQWSAGVADDGDLWMWIGSYLVPGFVRTAWDDAWVHPWPQGFGIRARLDDTDYGRDDVIVGWVPEPGAMGLLALGAIALLRRRLTRPKRVR